MENKKANKINNTLMPIPAKRYFTIGEVGVLCDVKPHVLRYWEQEFPQLRPVKRRGNRRYYQQQEVLLVRRIRELLYDQGFTINGARNQLECISAKSDACDGININLHSSKVDLGYIRCEIKSIVSQLLS
ncbi:MerR family transcriptional regulator [Nitrosomonas supralitoralis]|uniref:MerR family transcriptional regulator n=1 Tax=Nitrosomonas supralitoralis TaxID=2116706 RepID=A0A2P7NV81_9PROT|nr:MerR family transcriptional regulator [Nitrosomonas supralitoralis]PSJ17377.1 MerR family transcriptional regulator [Nitrosomonas supralitoralis]